MAILTNFQLKIVAHNSDDYQQAALLRYRLFYEDRHIPFESIFDPQESQDLHLAMIEAATNCVIAYGRLGQNSSTEFKIYQMVVEPEYQGQGLGKIVLQKLIQEAIDRGCHLLVLNAKIAKVGFYQKLGFETIGEIFESVVTADLHIKMQKHL
jgi:GNAT superfamily N-acetyltransferase